MDELLDSVPATVDLTQFIPRSGPSAPTNDAAFWPRTAKSKSRARRILVVDDNVDHADCLAQYFILMGQSPVTAENGTAAIELAAGLQIEAAIIDFDLPDMNGCDLVRKLQTLPGCVGTVFIAVSGHPFSTLTRAGARTLFHFMLLKPVDLEIVQKCVESFPEDRS
jgi:CheY-like chemotaxis protein